MSSIIAEHPNAALVRRGYEAFNTADMETLTQLFDESASWHTPGRSPLAGDRVGRDAVFAQFGQYGGQTGGTFRATLQHLLTDDDGRVIGIHHNTAERNGKKLDVYCCIVFEIKTACVFPVGSTSTTSTRGTSSGRSSAGASTADHADG